MQRSLSIVSRLALALASVCANACSLSYDGDECDEGRPCEAPLRCDVDRPDTSRRCIEDCDGVSRCDNGAWCTSIGCTGGGTVGDGEVATDGGACAFGLAPVVDYTSDPLVSRCRPVCNVSADCPAGTTCQNGAVCMGSCMGPGATVDCEPPNRCADTYVCANERRYDRADCDGDGVLDCQIGLVCDPEAIGGCAHPPMGEE